MPVAQTVKSHRIRAAVLGSDFRALPLWLIALLIRPTNISGFSWEWNGRFTVSREVQSSIGWNQTTHTLPENDRRGVSGCEHPQQWDGVGWSTSYILLHTTKPLIITAIDLPISKLPSVLQSLSGRLDPSTSHQRRFLDPILELFPSPKKVLCLLRPDCHNVFVVAACRRIRECASKGEQEPVPRPQRSRQPWLYRTERTHDLHG